MANNENIKFEAKIRSIDLLNSSFITPLKHDKPIDNFQFNISLENNVNVEKDLIYILVSVEIQDESYTINFGSASVCCIFEVNNLKEIISITKDNYTIPPSLNVVLNSISLSTTRGVLYTLFKGTFLDNAILPIVDPKQFQPVLAKSEI